MSFRIVILPPYAEPDWPERLAEVVPGIDVAAFDDPGDPTQTDALRAAVADTDAVYGNLPPDLFETARQLRWICAPLAGLGPDWFHPALVESDVVVTNMRGIYNDSLGHHLVALVLAFARRLDVYGAQQRRQVWNRQYPMIDLTTSTVLVVGVGGSGAEAGRVCAALGMRVIGTDARATEAPGFEAIHPVDALDDLLGDADFVLVTVPETPDTVGMFDAARFARMKSSAYFCNIARGRLVVTDDLVAALENGELAGAGLDVVDPEPLPPEHPLWSRDAVILTPHSAIFGAPGWYERRTEILLENARRFAAGDVLMNVVDKRACF